MKNGIILLAHGSTYPDAVEQNETAARQVEKQLGIRTLSAFMELSEPSLETAFTQLADEDITHITVLLMFLFEGYHTRITIPGLVEKLQKAYPHININISDVLRGDDPKIAEILAEKYTKSS